MGISDVKQHHTIWTPELVELSMPLAGIARRCVARIIDQTVLAGIYVVLIIMAVMNIFHNYTASVLVSLVLFVLADFIYFWAFHAFMNGQTPGKKLLGIRVVTPRGGRINLVTSLIRSLFNIADVMLFAGGVSSLMILGTEQEKRIADFAAGTIVVRDR
ncbi:MAG: hypothetical protein K0Q50_1199 [Vampirovibrio sp.]|nr:hypothetical protein [Vampirovibrio sp.]